MNPSMPEEFKNFLNKLLKDLYGDRRTGDDSNNPEDYDRSECLDSDEDSKLMLGRLLGLKREIDAAIDTAKLKYHEGEVLRAKLFAHFDKKYPQVTAKENPDYGGCGYRRWKGAWWLVGWNDEDEDDKDSDDKGKK